MTRVSSAKEARLLGLGFGAYVLNQADPADNGWHFFLTREEAQAFIDTHPDSLNETTIDKL